MAKFSKRTIADTAEKGKAGLRNKTEKGKAGLRDKTEKGKAGLRDKTEKGKAGLRDKAEKGKAELRDKAEKGKAGLRRTADHLSLKDQKFDSPGDAAPADPDERSPQLGIKFKDLAVLGQLIEAGADLAKPRQVTYYLYGPDADVAEAMADAATARGFDAEVRDPLPEDPEQWCVVCEMETEVSPDFVRETTDFFEALAEEHHAVYESWEASAI